MISDWRRTAPVGIPVFLYSLCFCSLYCRLAPPLGIPVFLYSLLLLLSLLSPYCPPRDPRFLV